MARPLKKGIDYFPLDVNFMRNIKVRKIIRACSEKSIAVLISLLGNVYEDHGYYTVWDNDIPFLIADEIGVSEGLVTEIVNKAVQVEFFDSDMFEKYKILTSSGIQKRYLEATSKRKRVELIEEYLLLDINVVNNLVNVYINSINVVDNTQSKVKESKVNKSINIIRSAPSKNSSGDKELSEDFKRVIEAWNSISELKNIKKISANTKRYNKLKGRISEYGIDKVLECVHSIERSSYLKGYISERGWQANFDWFIEPANFLKVFEGNYEDKAKPNKPASVPAPKKTAFHNFKSEHGEKSDEELNEMVRKLQKR
ncbi:DUF4373 domain-containing protein [Peptostreptococcus faecalis]|uniref:DUF4373 domain-containing protein n=1 Tax=Peptostreptococcus faecalis TaxID=2045015 RepID=UPI000C7A231F|nr:DUF4373 domain-containing protein [Peptostreptococcus faecalis]